MIRKRTNSDKRPDEYGFTLIELLAAMAVVVILGGAVMPRIYTVVEQNRQAAYQAEALQAYSAAELYIDEACSEGGMDTMTLYQKLIMTDLSDPDEYYGTAEPPVRCGESHLSGLTEPLHFVY